jgi:apolipoprotein N-acyltransferase
MSRLRSQRLREVVFLAVGAATPVGILAVNGSAFVMQHLGTFSIGIAVSALVSGLSLNGLTAWAALNRAERFAPRLTEYRGWLLAATVAFVVVFSTLGAYWTFESMQDSRRLPNIYAVLTALWLLLLPVLMTLVARRLKIGAAAQAEEQAGRPAVAVPFESARPDRR